MRHLRIHTPLNAILGYMSNLRVMHKEVEKHVKERRSLFHVIPEQAAAFPHE